MSAILYYSSMQPPYDVTQNGGRKMWGLHNIVYEDTAQAFLLTKFTIIHIIQMSLTINIIRIRL